MGVCKTRIRVYRDFLGLSVLCPMRLWSSKALESRQHKGFYD